MGKNPDRVYKPRFSLYKKVQAYTQHPGYEPKPLSWFMCYYNVDRERMEHTLDYLVFKRFLMRLPSGRYGVDRDVRQRFTGRVMEIQGACFVKPDNYPGFIEIEQKFTFGARHNDRVRVAVNGYDESGAIEISGVIEEIIAPLSDWFCGRVDRDAEGFFVVPDDRDIGDKIYLAEGEKSMPVGTFVYARVANGDALREKAFEMAAPCQQLKTLSARVIREEWRDAVHYLPEDRVCSIIKRVSPVRTERFLIEKRFHDMLPPDAAEVLQQKVRRINYIRKDFTSAPICMVREDFAFHTEKAGCKIRFFAHVPDMTDDVVPFAPLEKALCYKGAMPGLVPEALRNKLRFGVGEKSRALTVVFTVDKLGIITEVQTVRSRIVCAAAKETPAQKAHIKQLSLKLPVAMHPVQWAAEMALAKHFGDSDDCFPYDNFGHSALYNYFEEALNKVTEPEKTKVLHCLDYYLFDRVLMPKAAGVCPRIPFGNPFDSFVCILTQWAVCHSLQLHKNKETEAEFKEIIRSRTAICMWQRSFYAEYEILCRTEAWKEKHPADGKTLHEGIFLSKDMRVPNASHNSFVYSDNNLIFCGGIPEEIQPGDTILFTAKPVHGGDVLWGAYAGLKKDF